MIPTRDELIESYKNNSISLVAQQFGVSRPTVRKWMEQYNIPRKSQVEAAKESNKKKIGSWRLDESAVIYLENKEWLETKLIQEQLTPEQVGEILGCSEVPVRKAIKKFGIKKLDGRRRNTVGNNFLEDKDWLYQKHTLERKTCEEIANLIGSSKATVAVWIKLHGLEANKTNSYPRKQVISSAPTIEIFDYIKSIYTGEVVLNDRKVCNGLELDILIPEKGLAIEFNGLFHHLFRPFETNFSKRKDEKYHLSKTELCNEKGIQLLHFFSDEWDIKSDIVKSMIRSKLGLANRIYARNTCVEIIDAKTKNEFMRDNHIQGEDRSLIKLGLFHEGTLKAVMTFGKPRFSNHDWELSRFATLQNTSIVGGFSKLLAYFKGNHTGSIVSYADRRYSQGNVYDTNGFDLIATNKPSYYYVPETFTSRFHRMHLQKKNLDGDQSMTEFELATLAGYHKIFDCGTLTYLLKA